MKQALTHLQLEPFLAVPEAFLKSHGKLPTLNLFKTLNNSLDVFLLIPRSTNTFKNSLSREFWLALSATFGKTGLNFLGGELSWIVSVSGKLLADATSAGLADIARALHISFLIRARRLRILHTLLPSYL